MAMVESNPCFTHVDIRCSGRVSDGGVYCQNKLGKYLEDAPNPLNIPNPKPLPGRTLLIPYFIVGDDAFPLKT